MNTEQIPVITSVAVPGDERPGLREPMIVSVEAIPAALEIRDALFSEPRLGGANLKVWLRGENARVEGHVPTEEQRDIIIEIMRRFVKRIVVEVLTGDQTSYFCEA